MPPKFKHFALARYTSAGRLDASFGQGGKIVTDLGTGSDTTASDVAIQSDSKIVAVGSSLLGWGRNRFELARYQTNGTLDATFGSGGKVLASVGRYSGASAIAIQRDGKLVVTGWSQAHLTGNPHLALVRYTKAGKLDASFGRVGKVLTSIQPAAGRVAAPGAVAVDSDGKIVVACLSGLARFNADGTPDSTFGQGGRAGAEPFAPGVIAPAGFAALAMQADGKIAVAGSTGGFFVVARYTTDGTLDPSFGSNGAVVTHLCSTVFCRGQEESAVQALALDGHARLVAAGATDVLGHRGNHPNTANNDLAVARYTPDGKLDANFGRRGKVITTFDATGDWDTRAAAAVIQSNGKIVVAGPRGLGAGDPSHDFLLIRYTTTGRLDSSFGRGGKVLTHFGSG